MGRWGERGYKRSKVLGIYKHKETGKYLVSIRSNYLGLYDNLCEAVKVSKKFLKENPRDKKDVRAWKDKNTSISQRHEDLILEEVDLGNLTQGFVAKKLGLSISQVSTKVRGEIKWHKKDLQKVKKMLSEESTATHYFRTLNESVNRGFNRVKAASLGCSDIEINAIFNNK
jgi:hypothetical protein